MVSIFLKFRDFWSGYCYFEDDVIWGFDEFEFIDY